MQTAKRKPRSITPRGASPNVPLDLTATIAAQRVLRPRCSLRISAAQRYVEHSDRTTEEVATLNTNSYRRPDDYVKLGTVNADGRHSCG